VAAAAAAITAAGLVGGGTWVAGDSEWADDRCWQALLAGVADESTVAGTSAHAVGWSWHPVGTRCVVVDDAGVSRTGIVGLW
jgi:hypothetical protein